jgi:IclR family acetate operon transcriptional repressor
MQSPSKLPPRSKQTNNRAVKKADPYFSRAIGKAFELIDGLSQSSTPLTLNQLSASVGLTKTSTFRILHTLEALGHVSKTAEGRYLIVGGHGSQRPLQRIDRMIQVSAPILERLRREFKETISLAAVFENHIEVVSTLESPQLIRMGNTVGRILPPHASSLGKAITAFQPPQIRERLLRSYGMTLFTPRTIVDETAIQEQFQLIQEREYAEDWEESTLGGCCFGAPIRRPNGYAIGALSLSMPKIHLKADEQPRIVNAVKRAALDIQTQLV